MHSVSAIITLNKPYYYYYYILPPSIYNLLSTVSTDHAAVHEAAGGGEGPHDPERGPGLVHAGPQQVQPITSTQTLHQQSKLCAPAHSKLLLF